MAKDKKRHILAINDDPAILQLFRDLLEDEGYEVTLDQFANSTGGLLQTVRSVKPDLVILDMIIGGEAAGWQLLQAIRMDPKTTKIPVVICSAAVKQIEELRPHLQAMKVQYVFKPFDIEQLLFVIDTIWKNPEAPIDSQESIG